MFKLGRRKKSPQLSEVVGSKSIDADEAIVHETVPDAVLYSDSEIKPSADMSWLDSVPSAKTSDTAETVTPVEPVFASDANALRTDQRDTLVAPELEVESAPVEPVPAIADLPANGEAVGRPRFPCGWLVVVEGPGVGEWFVLERGVSHIGSAAGQTVCLDFGDASIGPEAHGVLAYDDDSHAFVFDGGPAFRVNGVSAAKPAMLRDGDVITVGGTGLRLVALCSQNFNWNAERTGA